MCFSFVAFAISADLRAFESGVVATDKGGTFLFLFCAGSALFTRRQMYQGLDSGTFWDLCYIVPLLAAIAGASTWKAPCSRRSSEEQVRAAKSSHGVRFGCQCCSRWSFLALPAGLYMNGRCLRPSWWLSRSPLPDRAACSHIATNSKPPTPWVKRRRNSDPAFEDNPQPTCLYDPTMGSFSKSIAPPRRSTATPRDEFLTLTIADICPDLASGKSRSCPSRDRSSWGGLAAAAKRRQLPRSELCSPERSNSRAAPRGWW